jgi:hypothetical protein
MTINDFIKQIRELFGDIEYKATSNSGQVFKSRSYDEKNAQTYTKKQTRNYK